MQLFCTIYLDTIKAMHKYTTNISNNRNSRCLKHAHKHWIFFCTNVLANSLAIETEEDDNESLRKSWTRWNHLCGVEEKYPSVENISRRRWRSTAIRKLSRSRNCRDRVLLFQGSSIPETPLSISLSTTTIFRWWVNMVEIRKSWTILPPSSGLRGHNTQRTSASWKQYSISSS